MLWLCLPDDVQGGVRLRHTHQGNCFVVQDDTLLAYQVCFDLFENESQSFLLKVGSGNVGEFLHIRFTSSIGRTCVVNAHCAVLSC
jgi:hypothetical protein